MRLVAPPLSLYVHLPWCVRKCPYCDFNSHALPAAGLQERAYVDALLADLDFAARDCAGRELVSVFFGGGTPSLFAAESIGQVLERAAQRLHLASNIEVTLEANPGTVERGRFADYRAAGVTRVSLGAQSFEDASLAALGRIHGSSDTLAAVKELRAAGLDNFNLDLMYALPRQTLEAALADLEQALALRPAHLSHYQLTLEPGTAFERRPPPLPDDDTAWAMQVACQARLAEAGYRQYEVSAYSAADRECRHNLNYWRFGDYLGIGAGAHGKLTDAVSGRILRTARVRQPGRYLAATEPADRLQESRTVPTADLPFEFFLNALRIVDGFEVSEFEARTGLPWASVASRVARAEARGLMQSEQAGRWTPTALGQRFLNDLQLAFLPDPPESPRAGSLQALASTAEIG
jgi:oxygen-independent coproporphyrinogen-3 oxidase